MFSSVVNPTTIRLVLYLVVSSNWSIQQLDVKNTFLPGHLKETIHMEKPLGFFDPSKPSYVSLVQKSLYGLK